MTKKVYNMKHRKSILNPKLVQTNNRRRQTQKKTAVIAKLAKIGLIDFSLNIYLLKLAVLRPIASSNTNLSRLFKELKILEFSIKNSRLLLKFNKNKIVW